MIPNEIESTLNFLFYEGLDAANCSHKLLFKSDFNDDKFQSAEQLTAAVAYLSEAHNYYLQAKILILNNDEVFKDLPKFKEHLHRFFVYNDEFLTNLRTNHSHQWSDIEFRAFVKSFKDIRHFLKITNIDNLINEALDESE